jgi:hypothetical protein
MLILALMETASFAVRVWQERYSVQQEKASKKSGDK